ncbi:small-conductance mechanosensitive channel [Rivularia sp. PCC 7116]|uniref:mechanosensitive ion channel family protein n=1 Tax=Rivularia sp. PCC 7116 TaxID=373994 RepID=UPI00029F3A0C|nr:mechanosensitive ion channel domain-containing protein [Rivularia sp. PCC 7116]AFY52702.1 small-conductance mechanosensitive channel [Rivularia sp. PCC 7116]
MNIVNQISDFLLREDIRNVEIFIVCVIAAFLIGRYTPSLIQIAIKRFLPPQVADIYQKLIYTNRQPLKWAGTSILLLLSVGLISQYQGFYALLKSIIELAVILSIAILASGVFRQLIRTYGVAIIRKLGYQADDLLLILETIVNVIIGFTAILVFANERFNLVGLITGLGIGGLAVAFAAQKTLEQFLGTIVIYLDRPFITGEYIHLPPGGKFTDGIYGRVESIGFRSTKIRSSGKSTLVIVPNSILANVEVENVTRGKKVMVLLYFDFNQKLLDKGQALVRQVVEESMESLFGVEPDTTKVVFEDSNSNSDVNINDNQKIENTEEINSSTTLLAADKDSQPERTRARITFFLLGSNQNSLELRKQLVNLANEKVSHQLNNFGIEFVMQEPNIYIEAPVTI